MRLPIAQCPCERRTVCRHLLSLSLSIAIAFGLTAAGCKPAAPKASDSGPAKTAPVLELSARDVAEASAESILAGVRVAGTLNPAVRVEIKSQASGQLDAIHADRGTVITQNQVLAILEDRGAKAQVESMKSQLAAAERDFNASEVLFKAGAASERTYVNSKVSVDSAKAQLTQAQLTVERGTVISPLAGTVSERLISAGEAVTPGQKLFTVVNSDNLECAASVLPADIVNGFVAPAGTPQSIIDFIHREVVKVMAAPDTRERLMTMGFDPVASTPAEFAIWIRTEIVRWGKVIREAKITLD